MDIINEEKKKIKIKVKKMINREYANKVIQMAQVNGMPLQLSRLMAFQSAYESANWTSRLFKTNLNGFGYKFVKGAKLQLPTPGIHSTETDNYAAYATFENSIKEVCLWILRRQKEGKFPVDLVKIQTPKDYATLLKSCGYFGGKLQDYIEGIDAYMKQYDSNGSMA